MVDILHCVHFYIKKRQRHTLSSVSIYMIIKMLQKNRQNIRFLTIWFQCCCDNDWKIFIQSQKIREKIRRHQQHQSMLKTQAVKNVQMTQHDLKTKPYNKPVRITHKQSRKCFTTSRFQLCFLTFHCNFSEFSIDMGK